MTPATIRFYERKRVLPAAPRQANRYRTYDEDDVSTLRLARSLRQLGVSLENVRQTIRDVHSARCGEIRRRMLDTVTAVVATADREIASLQETRSRALMLRETMQAMQLDEEAVPDIASCQCVQQVARNLCE